MKRFNRLLIIAIIFAVFYYFWHDAPQQPAKIQQPAPAPPPPAQVQKPRPQPPAPPKPAPPEAASERLLPSWPPVPAGQEAVVLDELLTRKNFVLVLDGSGSMARQGCSGNRSKHEVAREAVVDWAAQVPENAALGLVVFDRNGFSTRLPLGLANRAQFKEEVLKVVPDNKTPLTEALATAYGMLTQQAKRQLGYGDYTVVVVTDGAADDVASLAKTVDTVLRESPVMIHTIGFCIEADHSLNRAGRTTYVAANNPAELRRGLQEVLAEAEAFDIDGFK